MHRGMGFGGNRCGPTLPRRSLIDELGTLSWRQLDERGSALAAALQALPAGPQGRGTMCRNHRGFVDALLAVNRIGAHILLLNTSFAGPALAESGYKRASTLSSYDEEFSRQSGSRWQAF